MCDSNASISCLAVSCLYHNKVVFPKAVSKNADKNPKCTILRPLVLLFTMYSVPMHKTSKCSIARKEDFYVIGSFTNWPQIMCFPRCLSFEVWMHGSNPFQFHIHLVLQIAVVSPS